MCINSLMEDMKKYMVKLTSMVKSSGCASKLSPLSLHSVLDSLPKREDSNLILGYDSSDDAFVYDLKDGRVLVETVDFFPPMVDDPYTFGEVAACNALSDVYAMGGDVDVCLSLMCFPSCLDLSIMREILLGGMDKVKESGGIIAGGHTISSAEPKYGLCVTSIMKREDVWTNRGARVGDSIVLTKSLGVGILNTMMKGEESTKEEDEGVVDSMTRLNKRAKDIARKYTVHAATDVTGFSLLGHSGEVALSSNVEVHITFSRLPLLKGALRGAEYGFLPEGMYNNYDYMKDKVLFSPHLDQKEQDIALSPETSGGLLLFMSHEDAVSFCSEIDKDYCAIIGDVRERGNYLVTLDK